MGLEKSLNNAFHAFLKNKDVEGSDEVVKYMVKTMYDDKNPKQYEAGKLLFERYFGKEPKAIIVDSEVNHSVENIQDLKDFINNATKED